MFVVAVVDGIADVLACVGELLGGRRGWLRAVEQLGQLGVAVLQVDEFGAQVADSGAALGVGERAGFEREQVAFDGLFGLGDVSVDDVEFGRPRVFRTAACVTFLCCVPPVQVLVVHLVRGSVAEP